MFLSVLPGGQVTWDAWPVKGLRQVIGQLVPAGTSSPQAETSKRHWSAALSSIKRHATPQDIAGPWLVKS